MKKLFVLFLVLSVVLCSCAFAAEKPKLEATSLKWARDNSGNAFVAIAMDKGWFDEIGLHIEEIPIDANADALSALVATRFRSSPTTALMTPCST